VKIDLLSKFKLFNPLRFLLGKLLLSYFLVTLAAFTLASGVRGLIDYYFVVGNFQPDYVAAEVYKKAQSASEFLNPAERNLAALRLWMRMQDEMIRQQQRKEAPAFYYNLENFGEKPTTAIITDENGIVQASLPENVGLIDYREDKRLNAADLGVITAVLRGERDFEKLAVIDENNVVAAAAPIHNADNKLIGVLLVRVDVPLSWSGTFLKLGNDWLSDAREMLLAIIIFGLFFSFFVARNLSRRLNKIAATATAWKSGDFTRQIKDECGDEISVLGTKLDAMALELNNIFALKQELAAVEVRNKLARELHDSVKQQVFGLSMQIGAARSLAAESLNGRAEIVNTHLGEAQSLAHSVQQELVDLINELRPSATKNENVGGKIERYASDWARQNNINLEIKIADLPPLASPTEHALFRIVQEALANIVRHSLADHVKIQLEIKGSTVSLIISDNGQGFAPLSVKKGYGLNNIQERTETLPAGKFNLQSESGAGTRLEISFLLSSKLSNAE
jgi:signal transduction histidine kinase